MKTIPLSRDKHATVDDADHDRVKAWSWHALSSCGYFYAARNGPRGADGRRPKLLLGRWLLDAPAHMVVIYRNGDTLDNRRENLVLATAPSLGDRTASRAGQSREPRGVQLRHGRFRATITRGGRTRHLGTFDTADEASAAYQRAAAPGNGGPG